MSAVLPDLEALPVRVRPAPHETIDSYADRLREENFLPVRRWRNGLRSAQSAGTDTVASLESAVETLGELRGGHFAAERISLPAHEDGVTCAKCTTGLELRFGCTRCTGGATARQSAHDGSRVCRKHRRWIGPGTPADEQYQVGAEAIRDDDAYRRLRRDGVLDAHRLAELLGSIDYWCRAEVDAQIDPATKFGYAISFAKRVLAPLKSGRLWARTEVPSERYSVLAEIVFSVAGAACITLVDAIWTMIRTAEHQADDDAHRIIVHPTAQSTTSPDDLEPMRSSAYPQVRHRHLIQFVSSAEPGTRFDLARLSFKEHDYVCALGHRFSTSTRTISGYRASDGCKFCARRAPLAGFNTLADTHPHLAAEWHPVRNKDLRPEHVLSGSSWTVHWLCPSGHSYPKTVVERTRGVNCGVCANYLVDPHTNSLAVTHPELASQWHPTKNGETTPMMITAGSNDEYWWLCADGHDFSLRPIIRKRGKGCTVCNGRALHRTTTLKATHPAVAALWHPSLNGDIGPDDIGAGSGKRTYWLCERGHVSHRVVRSVVGRPTCEECVDRVDDPAESMSVTHPHLAAEFHPTRNGSITPEKILAGTRLKLWWRCARGHEWPATGKKRVTGAGRCLVCANRRVVPGENDMATTHPALAQELHPSKNHGLSATSIVAGTNKKLWWRCAKGHEWPATGNARVGGRGCRECVHKCVSGLNDLSTTHPAIARHWDGNRNGNLLPSAVLATTERKRWWMCERSHAAYESAKVRVERGGCAEC
ncbi:zinc-ribbon domain-containing protein [Microbacterium sp. NPDC090225]|uniref:zinc-ribbon domain-containing protein n=1 Tax=Microbacterium sp. NPDC090225 TaxID=3364207 RepID=UPI003805B420